MSSHSFDELPPPPRGLNLPCATAGDGAAAPDMAADDAVCVICVTAGEGGVLFCLCERVNTINNCYVKSNFCFLSF